LIWQIKTFCSLFKIDIIKTYLFLFMNYFNSIIEFREVIFEKTMFFSLKNTKLIHATFYRCGTTIFLLSELSEKLKVKASIVYMFKSKNLLYL